MQSPFKSLSNRNPARDLYQVHLPDAGISLLRETRFGFEKVSPPHAHARDLQVLIVLEGNVTLLLPDTRHSLSPGGACVIPAGRMHQIDAPSGVGYYCFLDLRVPVDPPSTLRDYLFKRSAQIWGSGDPDEVVRQAVILRNAATSLDPRLPIPPVILSSVWARLDLCFHSSLAGEVRPDPVDPRLAAVDLFMRDRLKENLSIVEFAEAVHLSRSQLSRLFQDHWGVSPAAHYRSLRLNLAQELLAYTTLPIREIAERCGYHNLSHFSTAFHKHAGLPPGRVRHQQALHPAS
ncbi:MAG: helix-turn-helix domain-containing protein [Kiritimatiellae bacterium]|jgi:AraC-like DNA-binding protein/mannose-6-phosphate isomerase-like protein (cupin superfamily)|nr:helix-turn-helix domain-containing protein [Kiritimatiellia bacterium]